jgi:vacuolar protein sorting-associated protein 54
MLRDAEHFKTRIGGLDGAGDAGYYIVNLIKEKSVPKPKPLTPAPIEKEETATNGKNGKTSSEVAAEIKILEGAQKAETNDEVRTDTKAI